VLKPNYSELSSTIMIKEPNISEVCTPERPTSSIKEEDESKNDINDLDI